MYKYDTKDEVLNNFEDYCRLYFQTLNINEINCALGSRSNCVVPIGTVSSTTIAVNINSINSILKTKRTDITFKKLEPFLLRHILELSRRQIDNPYDSILDLCLIGYINLDNIFNNNNTVSYIYIYDPENNKPLTIAKLKKPKPTGTALLNLPTASATNLCDNCYYNSKNFITQYLDLYINNNLKISNTNERKNAKDNMRDLKFDIGQTSEQIFTEILKKIRVNDTSIYDDTKDSRRTNIITNLKQTRPSSTRERSST